jgi:hypothetical protein
MMASFSLSLETAFLASAIFAFILLIALVYIKLFSVKIHGLSYWIFAYMSLTLMYGVLFFSDENWARFLECLLKTSFMVFLIVGMRKFLELPLFKYIWSGILAASIICDILLIFIFHNFQLHRFLLGFLIGGLMIYNAWLLFHHSRVPEKRNLRYIGVFFFINGLHYLDYPFLRTVEWFAPIGYLIANAFNQAFGIGLIILIMQKINFDVLQSKKKIYQLQGMLPICSICKKIRDSKGYWNQIDEYFRKNAGIEFTHGLCEECFQKYLDEIPESSTIE